MATRTQVRQNAIEILYSFDIGNTLNAQTLEELIDEKKLKNQKKEFAYELIYGVLENIEEIDQSIDKYLIDWELDRLGYIERAIFRLGAYEMIFKKNIGAVVIDELLSISKKYCDPKSTNFINGVLNSIYQNLPQNLLEETK